MTTARWTLLAALAAASCTTNSKTTITDEAFTDLRQRTEMMEATLRVMDAHPEYVDEFFEMTLRHPKTLDRMLAATARSVSDQELAQRVALQLVAHPRGLRRVMIETLDAAEPKGPARQAIVDAMATRADVAAEILVDNPQQLATVSKALIHQAKEHPDTAGKMKELVKDLITD